MSVEENKEIAELLLNNGANINITASWLSLYIL